MIRLRRLKLENFLSHRDTEVEFGDETYVILGDNASGKTSILRGIFFALFGEDLKEKTNRDQLINRRANASTVELEFIHRGNRYRVVRELSRKRNSAILEKNGKLFARGIREVKGAVFQSLGLAPDMFRNTVFVPQGEIVDLLKGRPQERRQILNRLLGLDEFGKKHEELKEEIKKLKSVEKVLENQFLLLTGTEREIEEEREKIEELKRALHSLEAEVEKLTENLEREKRDFEELRRAKEEFERLKGELERLRREREKVIRRVEELSKKLREIEERKGQIPQLRSEVQLLKFCEELNGVAQELILVATEKRRTDEKRNKAREELQVRKELEGELPKLESELERKREKLSSLKEEKTKLTEEVETLKEREKQFREIELKRKSLEEQIERLKKGIPKVTKEEVEELESRIKTLEGEIQELKVKREKTAARIGEIEEKLKLLQRETSECPVCGGELTPEKREKLKAEAQRELKERIEELKALEIRLKEAEREFLEERRKWEKLKEELRERERREEEISRLEKKLLGISTIEFREEELKEKLELLEKVKEELSKLEREIALTEARVGEIKKQLSRLPEEKELEKLEEELKEIVRKEKTLKKKAAEIKERSGINVSSTKQLKELIKNLREKQELLNKIEGEVKSEREFRELLKQLQEELREKGEKEKELLSQIEGLNFKESLYLASERAVKSTENTLKKKREKLNRVIGELKSREENLKRLEGKRVELHKVKENIQRVKNSLYILQRVQESVHPERGFLKRVRTILLPQIAKSCKEFFSSFDFEFGDLFISEDLSVEFGMPGQGTMLLEDLSGGQQVAFALALRFAMARNFSQSMELLILDEPTVHLDAQRRMGLTELLLKLKGRIPQMLIVTHDPELEVAGDRVIRVKNHGGCSLVEVGA